MPGWAVGAVGRWLHVLVQVGRWWWGGGVVHLGGREQGGVGKTGEGLNKLVLEEGRKCRLPKWLRFGSIPWCMSAVNPAWVVQRRGTPLVTPLQVPQAAIEACLFSVIRPNQAHVVQPRCTVGAIAPCGLLFVPHRP